MYKLNTLITKMLPSLTNVKTYYFDTRLCLFCDQICCFSVFYHIKYSQEKNHDKEDYDTVQYVHMKLLTNL